MLDGLWRFARAHPSDIDDRLMQRRVGPNGDDAFDADYGTAYAQLPAAGQWGNVGSIDYRREFDRPIAGIEASTIRPANAYPLLGDWVQPNGWDASDPYTQRTTRTSDFMPGHSRAYRRAPRHEVWDRVSAATQDVVGAVQPDISPHDGHNIYNAGRTP